ncbi:uncharacterized protein LOC121266098 isoform X1 [Juglans microcarpa x Juglans regia]|uniref:uncharacterized protein LOC121266098 isoform X1 n=1 Tax=Juglans microcarpa x Juglans regia TaxID=2249226 RepID=UPI001B7E4FD5|nr:uncharacterized protein LOC121266098 isoform X1 [Juglans microcarpa x Juglans regia]
MRIRKRQVPLPLSSLSPVPLSDPLLNRSPVVQLQLHDATHPKASNPLGNLTPQGDRDAHFDKPPSDQPNQLLSPIGGGSSGLDCSDDAGGTHQGNNKKDFSALLLGEDERRSEREKGNDIRRGGILGAETVTGVLPESSTSHQAPGRWCEGEKAFPPKKRRSTFERRANEDAIMEKDKKMIKTKMKTKMNKKCAQQYDEGEEKETKEAPENTSAKKRGRGGALMEGSRCSRVNGRGWRCCQQTLVGYSLCEHHLGKGRLRSMASVRSRSLAGNNTAPKMDHESEPVLSAPSSSLQENKPKDSVSDNDGDDDGHEDEKKPLMVTKKRMKLGMVKARSISSLLGETNNGHNVMADNHHDQ